MRSVFVALLILTTTVACRRTDPAASAGGDATESGEGLPASVFGGGRPVRVEVEASSRLKVHLSFETNGLVTDPNHRFIERWAWFPAGKHAFTIAVPDEVHGGVDAVVEGAKQGDRVRCAVSAGDAELADEQVLDQPLGEGNSFFAQVDVGDWVTLRPRE